MTDPAQSPEDRAVRLLRDSDAYRVLERLEPTERYQADPPEATRRAMFVDVETTGLDAGADAIIQFSGIPFEYGPSGGGIYSVGPALTGYEDPGRPIPRVVVELTGITDEKVRGQKLDVGPIEAALESTELVIAHNAEFDRAFLERRIPAFGGRVWGCSQRDVPWLRETGVSSLALETLLYRHCSKFFDAHDAEADCRAGIDLLATPFASGRLPMAMLLEAVATPTVRVWARGCPFDQKDELKRRGYRWYPGGAAHPKCWYRDLSETEQEAELDWLEQVYSSARERVVCEHRDPTLRHARVTDS